MKLLSVRARTIAVCPLGALVVGFVSTVSAQTNYYAPSGTEYPIAGPLLGDQMCSDAAISTTNGIIVWQDNAIDGNGLGNQRATAGLARSPRTLSPFRVNVTAAGGQENATRAHA